MAKELIQQLSELQIFPSERKGQHFLIDDITLDKMAEQVNPGSCVIEVGAGPGNLTAKLAQHAQRTVAIELDNRFAPLLDPLTSDPNVEILYGNVLVLNLRKIMMGAPDVPWQIIASLPFHISEPFLKKVVVDRLPLEDMTLLIGNTLAHTVMVDSPNDDNFGKLSLLSQTFFNPVFIQQVPKEAYYPEPRTDTAIVRFYPSEPDKYFDPKYAIYKALFMSEKSNSSVARVLDETCGAFRLRTKGRRDKESSHRQERRVLKRQLRNFTNGDSMPSDRNSVPLISIKRIGLPDRLLSMPFSSYNNLDIRLLALTLQKCFG
jgi:16S rRNA A1518/A1519 N6-dimethyltransferase RsmA/KsgA/DIM1 with predicted DNA glycosylase/AP lyase activity